MTLRWGLLSTAAIGGLVTRATRGSAGASFVAVASRDAARSRRFAEEAGLPGSFGSYEELLDSDAVDAVYVALPNSMHTRWTVAALEAGKHVLCEKPFALSAADAAAAFDAAENAGRGCAEAFMYRFHPQTALARRLVADGAIGELRTIRTALSGTMPPGDIRWDPALGGGALLDLGAYCVSAARLFAGTPDRVYAEARHQGGVDARMTGTLRFPGDVLAVFDVGMDMVRRDELELVGSEGVLVVPDPWLCRSGELVLRTSVGTQRIPVPALDGADIAGEFVGYRHELECLSAALAAGEPLPFGRDDAVEQAAVLAALRDSALRAEPLDVRQEIRA